jgi:twitching motility protein PilT
VALASPEDLWDGKEQASVDNEALARALFQLGFKEKLVLVDLLRTLPSEENLAVALVKAGQISEQLAQQAMKACGMKKEATPSPQDSPSAPPSPQPRQEVQPSVSEERPPNPVPSLPEHFRGSSGQGTLRVGIPDQADQAQNLNELLLFVRKINASDLHLIPGRPAMGRRFSQLIPLGTRIMERQLIEQWLRQIVQENHWQQFLHEGDLEWVHTIEGGGRYRMTLMRERFGMTLTARVVSFQIPTPAQIGLPEVCLSFTKWSQGLVLITGPVGCGKTTTMASLVNHIHQAEEKHIISIERPIEMVFPSGRSQFMQREVGSQTLSQEHALKGALRQDPDILVISELRDLDTIQLAVSAAETGHLVFGTMNTANAMRTLVRLIDTFPPEEQGIIRNMLSLSLRGVISQQLLPRKDGKGVISAFEVLVVTQAISNLIRKNNAHLLESAMLTGKSQGMVLLDESLLKLAAEGVVQPEEALKRAINPKRLAPLQAMIQREG